MKKCLTIWFVTIIISAFILRQCEYGIGYCILGICIAEFGFLLGLSLLHIKTKSK